MTKTWAELEEKYKAGCVHCNHPLYAGIRCSVCGRWTDTTHTCGFHCERPECIKTQRDELLRENEHSHTVIQRLLKERQIFLEAGQEDTKTIAKITSQVEANTAEIRRYHKACEMALEALTAHADLLGTMYLKMDAAKALREVLGGKE